MYKHGYVWYKADELCRRLGLASGCLEALSPSQRDSLPRLEGHIRADVGLRLLRPQLIPMVCRHCLKELDTKQRKRGQKYCSMACRNQRVAMRVEDRELQRLAVTVTRDFAGELVKAAGDAGLTMEEFLRAALAYGAPHVIRFQRLGSDSGSGPGSGSGSG